MDRIHGIIIKNFKDPGSKTDPEAKEGAKRRPQGHWENSARQIYEPVTGGSRGSTHTVTLPAPLPQGDLHVEICSLYFFSENANGTRALPDIGNSHSDSSPFFAQNF